MDARVRHSFLFQEGTWTARGVFRDGQGRATRATGRTTVHHRPHQWINEGLVELAGDPPVSIRNRYEITPFATGAAVTDFRSHNPALGEITGRFVVVGDTILSSYATADGVHSGAETIRMLDERHYENRGYLIAGNTLVSTWEVTLTRDERSSL